MNISKKLFGNLVTYKGKYLSTAKAKASNGNLVFAQITEGDDKGYYIYAGGAEGHLVDLDTFKALKQEVAGLTTKLGTFTEADVPAYVAARIAELSLGDASKKGVATTIGAADVATDDNLATEKAVRDAVDAAIDAIPEVPVKDVTLNGASVVGGDGTAALTADTTVTKDSTNLVTSGAVEAAISSLGTVMEFKGVVEGDTLPDVTPYNAGDVIIWKGEEYVLGLDNAWHEIGQVKADEAVLDVKIADADAAYVETSRADGVITLDLDVATTIDDSTATGSLADAKAIKDYVDTAVGNVPAATVTDVQGDADTYSVVDSTDTVYTVKNTLATAVDLSDVKDHTDAAVTAATASGLATDGYVKDYVTSALAWEVLTDGE